MHWIRDNRTLVIAIASVLALVAIVVPTCRMVGCSMGGGMSWGAPMSGPGFFSTCGGTYVASVAPSAIVPASADSLALALAAVVVLAVLFAAPRPRAHVVRIGDGEPPPPPEDPLGTRLTI